MIATYDALLRDDGFAAEPPDLVLRFGAVFGDVRLRLGFLTRLASPISKLTRRGR